MSFLQELSTIRNQALEDQTNIFLQNAIAAFRTHVLTTLESMKQGIENEFRRKVRDTPKLKQVCLVRTVAPKTGEEIQGMCLVLQSDSKRKELLEAVRVLFPEIAVSMQYSPSYENPHSKPQSTYHLLSFRFTVLFN